MENDPYRPVDLRGQRAVIAGGTTGVGRATAELLASHGCRVFICGRDAGDLAKAISGIEKTGGEISGISADLGEVEGVQKLFKAADEWLGGLDIAVLNAGLGSHGELVTISHEELRTVVNVNLLSVIHCSREALERMSGKGGQIVMTGSMSAEVFDKNAAVYTATKAGVRGFAGSLRKEANPLGVRVSLLEPGSIGTDMVDESAEEQRRMQEEMKMLRAEDIARSILFVLTQPPRCDVITMQVRPHLQLI
jgi:NADP-dependent 3-hydroxy acid dehydrogenase YdfG